MSRRLADRRDLGLHPILAIFDEAHTLFEHEQYGDEAAAIAGRLIRKARAYAALVTYRPDLYGDWLPEGLDALGEDEQRDARTTASTMLASALKSHGVATRQINRRGREGAERRPMG